MGMSLAACFLEKRVTAIAHEFAETSARPAALQRETFSGASLTDEQLALRAQAGCTDSFEQLVRNYQVPLLRFLQKRCARKEDAEDVLQNSFLQAYRAIKRYDPAWPFRTWIYTLTHRLAISHARKTPPRFDTHAMLAMAPAQAAPSDGIEREEAQQSVWTVARNVLNDEQFTAIFLQYIEEMPTAQIAQVLNRTWVSTKTLLHRARKKLIHHLPDPTKPSNHAKRGSE
jgi:RNA polymerase sigma-70 factor (ECF subfamily)